MPTVARGADDRRVELIEDGKQSLDRLARFEFVSLEGPRSTSSSGGASRRMRRTRRAEARDASFAPRARARRRSIAAASTANRAPSKRADASAVAVDIEGDARPCVRLRYQRQPMAVRRRGTLAIAPDEALFAASKRKRVPFDWVLAELDSLGPTTNPMFGCTAVYVGERIVFILRDRPSHAEDNGVWLATTREHHASLRSDLPSLRSIGVLGGGGETGWQILSASAESFEEEVLRACAMVLRKDPRIGKIPKPKNPRSPSKTKSRERSKTKRERA